MFNYIWPLAVVVISNCFYHVCAKSMPGELDPFASLTITYVIGAVISLVLFYVFNKGGNLLTAYQKVNWCPFVLGLAIVGLEVGNIYLYKVGWPISTAQNVQASVLAIILIVIGYLAYSEAITWNKIVGIIVCLAGLGLINFK